MQSSQDAPHTLMLRELMARTKERDEELMARLAVETRNASRPDINPTDAVHIVDAVAKALEYWAVATIAAVEHNRPRIAAVFAANADVPSDVTLPAIQEAISMQEVAKAHYKREATAGLQNLRRAVDSLPASIPELAAALNLTRTAVDSLTAETEFIDDMYDRQITKLRATLAGRRA